MSSILENIDFGNEAGDDVDAEELASYFVEQDSFAKFIDKRKKLLIATARKGVGKSALLQWISLKVESTDRDAVVIKIRGADLVRSNFNLSSALTTPNDHIQDWMTRLCAIANRHLAQQMGLALTDDDITLVETAELAGYKSRNLVGCLVDRLQTLLKEGRTTTKISAANEVQLLKRTSASKDRNVWIIIDDLDATYQSTKQESLSLATFFSACRYLTRDLKGVYFRISLRTDVYPMLRVYDEAQDKTDQYVSEILWHQDDFLKLLALRVKASLEQSQTGSVPRKVDSPREQEELLDVIFSPTMQWGEKMVKTYKVIYTLSYERPRWAIQLCKLAKESTLRRKQSFINKQSIDNVWGEYGAKRIADLVAEHKHQCSEINELVNTFRGAERLLTREGLITWIKNRVCSHMDVWIEGKNTRDPHQIALFLYRIGFIVARSEDTQGNYEHYRFDQMPDVLADRTNEDFGVKWEIHPCYREALDIKKLNKSHKERFSRLRGGGK